MQGANCRKPLLPKAVTRNYVLYLFLLPAVVYLVVFHYLPLYGVQIAFKDFSGTLGIWGSPWVGLKHFADFMGSPTFGMLLKNTLRLSLYSLVVSFPIPIVLALMLNYTENKAFRKIVQNFTYAPYFISVVVLSGMILLFFSPNTGFVNNIIRAFGAEPRNFMQSEKLFPSIYVWSGVWQSAGWSSIIYISALAGIGPSLHEAATVDGASKWQRILHVDLPGILPTAVVILLLNMGGIMSIGFEKAFLLQNSMNITASEIISTYVYKVGIINAQYSFSTAVNLFNNVINIVLLLGANWIAKKTVHTGLW